MSPTLYLTHIPFLPCQSAIPFLGYVFYFSLKKQGQIHSSRSQIGSSSKSQSGSGYSSNHIPIVPCQSILSPRTTPPHLHPYTPIPEIQYTALTLKIKGQFMGEVKIQSHKMGLILYRLTSLWIHVNPPTHCCDTLFVSKFDLETTSQGYSSSSHNGTGVQHPIDPHRFRPMSIIPHIIEIR